MEDMALVDNRPSASYEVSTVMSDQGKNVIAPHLYIKEGIYTAEDVYRHLDTLKQRMSVLGEYIVQERNKSLPAWHRQEKSPEKRNPLVDQVFTEPLGDGMGGIVWSTGLTEACRPELRDKSILPIAPNLWSLRISNQDEFQEWQDAEKLGQAPELMRKHIYESLYSRDSSLRVGRRKKQVVVIHGWGGTVLARREHIRALYDGIIAAGERPEDYIIRAISPMGSLGTGSNISKDYPVRIEHGVEQCMGAIEGGARMLWEEFGYGVDGVDFDPATAYRNLGVVDGHSMGALMAAMMMKRLTPMLSSIGNLDIKWILENPVVNGVVITNQMKKLAQEVGLGIIDGSHVLLLTKRLKGPLVRLSPMFMDNNLIRNTVGEKNIVPLLVGDYLGGARLANGRWLWLNHNWTALHDRDFIRICNRMLLNAPVLIEDRKHLELMSKLVEEGRLLFAVGKEDEILTADPQFKLAKLVGSLRYRETVDHYDDATDAQGMGEYIASRASLEGETKGERWARLGGNWMTDLV